MQNYCKTIGALAAASALVAGNAKAELENIDYELHTGYTSEYLFRGFNLGQDLIEAGVDVATEFNGFGLSGGVWYGSIHAAPGFGGSEAYDEIDIYGQVSRDLGFATAAIGYIFYHFPESFAGSAIQDAQEVYFSLSRDLGFANASLTYFWDIETDNNGYTELALDRSFPLNQCLSLGVDTRLGYLVEEGQLSAWVTKVALDWAFRENAKLSPFVALSIPLSDDADTAASTVSTAGSKNQLVAGTMLSVSF